MVCIQRFLSITSDKVVFNENNILCVQKRNCVISIQLRPFSRHKSRKWTGMYLCVRGIDFASFCDFLFDIVFHLISRYFHHHHDLYYVYFSNDRLNIKWRKYDTVTFSDTCIFIFINFQMKATIQAQVQELHLIQVWNVNINKRCNK